jgi:DNA repair protein RecN (Recombination protein N)
MLLELSIRNYAIIDALDLRFGPGFSVLTGETGAGKSIIIDSLNLLLGSRADSTMVRSGATRAQIEGIFDISSTDGLLVEILIREQLGGDEPDRLVLSREIRSNGRSSSRVNGRIVNLDLLRQVSGGLVDIHGQSEHLSLMRMREHINLLDRYGGLGDERESVGELVGLLNRVRSELAQLLQDERELARRQDLLSYQITEIQNANLQPGEDEELGEERTRLANAGQLAALADEALAYLDTEIDELPAIRDLLGHMLRALGNLIRIDPSQSKLKETVEQLSFQTDDLLEALRNYREQVEFNPGRLGNVEERIELIRNLQRKYGDSIDDVLAFAQRAQVELDTISNSEERIAELAAEEERLLREIGRAGAALSARRQEAAVAMSAAVESELEDLRMQGARFGVDIQWQPDPSGVFVPDSAQRIAFSTTGLDRVEFLISPNPGEPLKPLVKIASGGETARLMLAIKTVLSRADHTPSLIFDEIDQGIGGRVGQTVGQKLWSLGFGQSGRRQVVCITHLPQLAGFGDTHYRVEKQVSGDRTTTRVQRLDILEDQIGEIAQMLGGETEATRESAREIVEQVQQFKESQKPH